MGGWLLSDSITSARSKRRTVRESQTVGSLPSLDHARMVWGLSRNRLPNSSAVRSSAGCIVHSRKKLCPLFSGSGWGGCDSAKEKPLHFSDETQGRIFKKIRLRPLSRRIRRQGCGFGRRTGTLLTARLARRWGVFFVYHGSAYLPARSVSRSRRQVVCIPASHTL